VVYKYTMVFKIGKNKIYIMIIKKATYRCKSLFFGADSKLATNSTYHARSFLFFL